MRLEPILSYSEREAGLTDCDSANSQRLVHGIASV